MSEQPPQADKGDEPKPTKVPVQSIPSSAPFQYLPQQLSPMRYPYAQPQMYPQPQFYQQPQFQQPPFYQQPPVFSQAPVGVTSSQVVDHCAPAQVFSSQVRTMAPTMYGQQAPPAGYLQQSTTPVATQAPIKGESRIEYVPYEKSYIEYQEVKKTEYVPVEKMMTDYYAVEHQVEYIPQVYQDRYMEYIPQERVQERIEYQAVEKHLVHQPVEQQMTHSHAQVVQTPPVQTQYMQQAPIQAQYMQAPVQTQYMSAPMQAQYVQAPQASVYQSHVHMPQVQSGQFSYAPIQQGAFSQFPAQQASFAHGQAGLVSSMRAPPLAYSGYGSHQFGVPSNYPQVPMQQPYQQSRKQKKEQREEKGFLDQLFE